MVVCLFFVMWVLAIVYYRERLSENSLSIAVGSLVAAIVIFGITTLVNCRVYNTEKFSMSVPRSECQFRQNKEKTTVYYQNNMYILPTANVVDYDAADKASEVIEIQGERRTYKTNVPDFIYEMFYLTSPSVETTIVTTSMGTSTYKPEKNNSRIDESDL